jgi:tetraacyldisaccharide 4'-kinase
MTAGSRRLLLPFVPFYAGVLAAKRWLRDQRLLGQRRLGHPVISVGSLSAGGAGKTPVVLLLAQLLGQRGFEVRILTRGYGRVGKLTERVAPGGDAARFGDEPLLLARRAPAASVLVGKDRYRAGMLAEREEPADARALYVLDDGFQHQRLAREIELLLITRQDLSDLLLPAGNLREPLRSVQRADFLVLREDETEVADALRTSLGVELPPILTIRRRLSLPQNALRRPLIFSGVARPQGFVRMLADAGINSEVTRVFPDHHRYCASDIEDLVAAGRRENVDGFVTTEKDAVKLTRAMLDRLEAVGRVLVAGLEVDLMDEAASIDALVSRLPAPRRLGA